MVAPEHPGERAKVVAHRGASQLAPENTMSAFRLARELGVDCVELDVHATADHELVVIHDYGLERTTTGTGLVADVSFAELSRLDAGVWFSPDFAGERVPRLDEVLALGPLEFEVELKTFTHETMDATVRAVAEAGVLERTEFTSWNTPLLMALKERCPEARIGLFSRDREEWMPDVVFERMVVGTALFVPADIVHVCARDVTPALVGELHRLGRIVQATDAQSVDEVRWAVECGADRVSLDDPRLASAAGIGSGRPLGSPASSRAG